MLTHFTSHSWSVIQPVPKDVFAALRFHRRAREGVAPSALQRYPFVSYGCKCFLLLVSESPEQRKLQRSQCGVKPRDGGCDSLSLFGSAGLLRENERYTSRANDVDPFVLAVVSVH